MTTTPTLWGYRETLAEPSENAYGSSIAALRSGGFAIVFERPAGSGATDLVGEDYNELGRGPGTNFMSGVSSVVNAVSGPEAVQLGNGNLAVGYIYRYSASDGDVYATQYSLSSGEPVPAGTQYINTSVVDDTIIHEMEAAADGGYYVLWQRAPSSGNGTVLYQRMNADGTFSGGPVTVDTTTAEAQFDADLTVLANGNVAVSWATSSGSTSTRLLRVFDSNGAPVTGEIAFAPTPNAAFAVVEALKGGGFVAVWQDVTNGGIYHRLYNAAGTQVGSTGFTSSTFAILPKATALPDGGYIIGWSSFRGSEADGSPDGAIILQRYGATGATVGVPLEIDNPGDQSLDDLQTLADGRVVLSFQNELGDSVNQNELAFQIIDPRDYIINGTAGADVITARYDASEVNGGDGNDTITAVEGDHILRGQAGNDSLQGGFGDDILAGGTGNDFIDGSFGSDTVSYSASKTAVTVDLEAETATGEGTDTITFVENITGSKYGDKLYGDGRSNTIFAGAGNDILYGGSDFQDILYGESGSDTASYATATEGIELYLSFGPQEPDYVYGYVYGQVSGGETQLYDMENAVGSEFGDYLSGSAAANNLSGGAGADAIYGLAGDDRLGGGSGNDQLDGGTGVDTVTYASATAAVNVNLATGAATGEGSDTLTGIENVAGSAYNDTLRGSAGANALDGGAGDDAIAAGGGNDTLTGGAGADNLSGETGLDRLIGGVGRDRMRGGTGEADTFVFVKGDSGVTASTADSILDWEASRDRIDSTLAGTSANYREKATTASTIEQAASAAEAAYASTVRHAFLYNAGANKGYLFSDLDGNGTYETGVELLGAGSAAAMNWSDIV